jgi:hypothetical protein
MTSVPPPDPPDEPLPAEPLPQATRPDAVTTAAATSTNERPRVDLDPIMCTSVLTARQTDCYRNRRSPDDPSASCSTDFSRVQ